VLYFTYELRFFLSHGSAMTLEDLMQKALLVVVIVLLGSCRGSFDLGLGSKKSSSAPAASQSTSLAASLPASEPTFLMSLKDKATNAWDKIDDVSISGSVEVVPVVPKIEVEITTPSTSEILLRILGIFGVIVVFLWILRALFGRGGRGRRGGGFGGGSSFGDGWGSGGGDGDGD
jgi:hypothetical protein